MRLIRSGEASELAAAAAAAAGPMEIGSIDSSDTYASCNTQPFTSQVCESSAGSLVAICDYFHLKILSNERKESYRGSTRRIAK